jgi:hypothetical protein
VESGHAEFSFMSMRSDERTFWPVSNRLPGLVLLFGFNEAFAQRLIAFLIQAARIAGKLALADVARGSDPAEASECHSGRA